jgi:competence protein ComEA
MQAKSKKLIFITILLTGCIITGLISNNDKEKPLAGSSLLQSAQGAVASKAAQTKTVRVQVSGAVLEPGIYDVPANCRVEEAIATAGGLTENADSERVNLVRKVRDGMQIRVPVQKAARTSSTQRKNAQAKSGLGESASGKYGSAKAGSGKKNNQMPRVRINSASASELQQLPGIGPALASALWKQETAGVSVAWRICCVCRE